MTAIAGRLGIPPGLLALAVAVVAVSTQPVFLLGAAAVEMGDEFGFGPSGLGWLVAAFFLTASAASAPLGDVVERIGWQRAMRINAVGSAAVLVAIATLAHHLVSFAALLMIGAVFYGLANPAANLALARHGVHRKQGLLFGLKHAGIPTSTLLAGLAVPVFVVTVGWRWAYVAAAIAAVVVRMLVAEGNDPARAASPPSPVHDGPDLLNGKWLALVGLLALTSTWAPAALGSFTVSAGVDVGLSQAAAGLLLAVGSVASISARIGFGLFIDRTPRPSFLVMAIVLGIGAFTLVGVALAGGTVFAVLLLFAFATAWGWPGMLTYSVVTTSPSRPAGSSARVQAGLFVGAGLGPPLFGALVEAVDYWAAWLVVAIGVAIAAGISLVVWRHQVRQMHR